MNRILFIGAVDMSRRFLSLLKDRSDVTVIGVVTRRLAPGNADFSCLADLAEAIGCPVLFADEADDEALGTFVRDRGADYGFCFGWSALLPAEVLTLPRNGFIGFHPAALPRNRGRHPIIWALALGLKETASTFFMMTEQADAGDIVSQQSVPILADDDAESLYARIGDTAEAQLSSLLTMIAQDNLQRTPQNPNEETAWRKRGKRDGEIDWRMTASAICNLVRALTKPYVGAHCIVDGEEKKIWKVGNGPSYPDHFEPGRVMNVNGAVVTVKCWGGSVDLLDHELETLPSVGGYMK